jgi:hypothetical protein
MKYVIRYSAYFMIALVSIGVLVVAGNSYAKDDRNQHDQQAAIVEGANQMQEGNKVVVDTMAKKGFKDPELTAARKKMQEGYDLIVKGEKMMNGGTMEQGKAMVTRGANMMMDADKATRTVVEKHGMAQECASALNECAMGEKKVKTNFQAYGLQGNWEGQQ